MSFFAHKREVEEGDLVILYLSVSSQYPIQVVKFLKNRNGQMVENKFQTVYGMLEVMSLVGKKYGSKVHLSRGWGWILSPTCELWTKTLPHRTQIIYTPDISLITFGLNLAPGSVVIEAGTGSGSLSHAIIRAIQPEGHLYTFDFHEKRANLAREEFATHGLSDWVTVGHRDAVSDGFNAPVQADAVFLDLPCPWDVIPHVRKSLKRGGRLCTFSPCIEQVQKTCEVLKRSNEFIMIRSQEVLQRPMSIMTKMLISIDYTPTDATGRMAPVKKDPCKFRTIAPPPLIPGHTGYITFATFVPSSSSTVLNQCGERGDLVASDEPMESINAAAKGQALVESKSVSLEA